MNTLYVLQNQHGYFLRKKSIDKKGSGAKKLQEWVDGQDLSILFRSLHKDEAINMQFEVNTRDVDLRITVKEYDVNEKKHPLIPEEDLPPPLPKQTLDKKDEDDASQHLDISATNDHAIGS